MRMQVNDINVFKVWFCPANKFNRCVRRRGLSEW